MEWPTRSVQSMTGIVLAGGRSRRMGFNKAFIEFNSRRLIDHSVELLKEIFEEVIVVVKDVRTYTYLNVRIVRDLIEEQGSLVGLYSGLLSSSSEYNFIAACDMPFLKKEVIHYLASLTKGYDAVIPLYNGHYEPLHGIYSRRCLKVLEERIRERDFRITSIFKTLNVRVVKEEEVRGFDPDLISFMNINTREDLTKLKELAR